MNIRIFNDQPATDSEDDDDEARPAPLACLIDNSCLRVIQLKGLDLPKLKLPHNKLLTHLSLKLINPPPLSQFLAFLSNCPSLKELELELQDRDRWRGFNVTTSTDTPIDMPIDKVGFVNLTRLGFGARGPSSLDFIRRVSEFIQILGTLSQFKLCYNPSPYHFLGGAYVDDEPEMTVKPTSSSAPFQIIEKVQSELFPSLSDYQYLSIIIRPRKAHFKIYGDISASRHRESDDSCPLVIDYENLELIHCLPVRALVQAMPRIHHLKLEYDAWKIFKLWPNIHDAFPCLHTLELIRFTTDDLNSLPDDLRFKKLILGESCRVSSESLFYVLITMGVEVLDSAGTDTIRDRRNISFERRKQVWSAFRERGLIEPTEVDEVGLYAFLQSVISR